MMKHFLLLLALVSLIIVTGCEKEQTGDSLPSSSYDNSISIKWFETFRNLTKLNTGFTPPVAARAFGYCGITLYESVVNGIPNANSLSGQLQELNILPTPAADESLSFAIVANAALADAARYYYANMSDSMMQVVFDLERTIDEEYGSSLEPEVFYQSRIYGKKISAAIFDWSKTDGGHEGYTRNFPDSYVVPQGEGLWIPTGIQLRPLQPFWGNNRTFIPNCTMLSQPETSPPTFSTDPASEFYLMAEEVYTTTQNLSDEQKNIAKFWSDDPGKPGTPPGHSISIALQILARENTDLALSSIVLAKVGIAVSDAFVSCWKCKYQYNLIRPVSYIKAHIDQDWLPILNTPPFPEFVSGHSSQSGAFAEVMTDVFGTNYSFIDSTHINRSDIDGTPRLFTSFENCAEEAAISRIYGGIHYTISNTEGLKLGKKVGEMVNSLHFVN